MHLPTAPINSPPPPKPGAFPLTRWSLVMRAGGADSMTALRAMGELLKTYWQPLYVFARRSGLEALDAEDAVQDFART